MNTTTGGGITVHALTIRHRDSTSRVLHAWCSCGDFSLDYEALTYQEVVDRWQPHVTPERNEP